MRRLITAVSVSLFVAAAAHGTTIRDNCGCGLGTMALGDQEATILSQVCATFLNGLSGNQTFGISSGTLECEPHAGIAYNKRVIEYVADNMDHLAHDMAMGQGDSLNALADLMDMTDGNRDNVFSQLQQGFDRIFPSADVTAEEVVSNIADVLQS